MNDRLDLSTLIAVIGLLISFLALLRDIYDVTRPVPKKPFKRLMAIRPLTAVMIVLFIISFWFLISRIRTLEKTNSEQDSKLSSANATQVAQAESIVAFETRVAQAATQLVQAKQPTPPSNLTSSPPPQMSSPTAIMPIAIDATKDWQSTGVFVQVGDKVTIRVVGGKWTAYREKLPDEIRRQLPEELQDREIWQNIWIDNAGDGIGVNCNEFDPPKPDNPCPVPSFYAGGLVGKIGTATPFGVGNFREDFLAPDNGIIYLRINDGQSQGTKYLDDNAGVLAVEIIVKR